MLIPAAVGYDTAQDFLLSPRRVSWKVSQSKTLGCNCNIGRGMGSRKWYLFIFMSKP